MEQFFNFITDNQDLILTLLVLATGGSTSGLVVALKKINEARSLSQTIIAGVERYTKADRTLPNKVVKDMISEESFANGNYEQLREQVHAITKERK